MQPLSTSDFKIYFERIPDLLPHWAGVTAIDEIPNQLKVKSFLIINTSIKAKKEGHWLVLSRPHKGVLELFNSLGYDSLEAIKPYLKFPFKSEIIFNNSPFQLPTTASCGLYCVYFAVYRFFNLDIAFEELIEDLFTPDLNKNEEIVAKFCHQVINMSNPHDLFLM